jgi:hypothetical protein
MATNSRLLTTLTSSWRFFKPPSFGEMCAPLRVIILTRLANLNRKEGGGNIRSETGLLYMVQVG